MSTREKWMSAKAIILIVLAAILSQVGATLYNTNVVQAETTRNTEDVQLLKSANKCFVIKTDNDVEVTRIYSLIQTNEAQDAIRNQNIIESIDKNQKFIIERIDNVNNNILKLYEIK